ncbi:MULTISPECIES: phosphoribosyltransferase [unclassified Parafrankia]|uniref:phosphoribosyltransferase n=1 Tax=unclassified Parafrankia TaxID=2994368 RepID=UPI000DA44B98|nr:MULTISPECIES: phosphoribosyltransferase family protein [unclassified Parafrankia]TCJ32240.1 hypothetical protein E0504_43945 [Parafrankia sp. BMG5.11]SQE00703.1 hypothetical protein FMEAI12_7050017 [Parafrankia sp. Ea1.12]
MSNNRVFRDRRDAGRFLAGLLGQYRCRPDVLVLGLARGGVPVAYEVAKDLGAPLDVFVVRKLGVPDQEELAMGTIASGGVLVLNDHMIRGMSLSSEVIQRVAEAEGRELLHREQMFRDGRPAMDVSARTVIVVDENHRKPFRSQHDRPLRGVVCLSGARPPTRTFGGSTAQRTGRDRPPHPR